jgi:hypothetical protein
MGDVGHFSGLEVVGGGLSKGTTFPDDRDIFCNGWVAPLVANKSLVCRESVVVETERFALFLVPILREPSSGQEDFHWMRWWGWDGCVVVEAGAHLLLGTLIISSKGATEMKPHSRDMAIYVHPIFARLQCMYDRSMCLCGCGCMACTVNARRVLMPHSFEWALYV